MSIEDCALYHHLIRVIEFHNDSVVLCILPLQAVCGNRFLGGASLPGIICFCRRSEKGAVTDY